MAKAQQQHPAPSWDGVLRRSLDFTVKAFDEENRSVEVVASTDTLDGHGDIVEQTFDLKRYKKNPVVLFLHNSFGCFDGSRPEDFLPIGRAENVKVADGQLEAKIVFASEKASPIAERIFHQFREGSLRAVSIGFKPGKVTRTENAETGKVTYRLANNELFEISVVPIPSNPDAVAKALHAAERDQLSRMAAQPAASSGVPREKNMNEELQKALEAKAVAEQKAKDAEARVGTAEAKIKSLETELGAATKSLTDMTTERNDAVKRAEKAENSCIERDVEALVGHKINPTQREKFIKLRKSQGEEEFKSFVAEMPDLPTFKKVAKDEEDTENHAKSGGTPKKIAARLEKVGS